MDLKSESGYTLVESLVAMTIFVSVLIPLASGVGNVLLQSDTSHQRKALHLAQSELAIAAHSLALGVIEQLKDGYKIVTSSMQTGRVTQITVRVSKVGSMKSLAVLHKALLSE